MGAWRAGRRKGGRWLWPAVALLAATGCTISSTGPQPDLEGRWIWVKSEGGLMPHDRTPASEGYTLALVFDATGRVRLIQDGTPVGETSYEVTAGAPGGSLDGVPVVRYGEPLLGFPEQAYQFVTRDSLLLADGCCDGFTWHFVREGTS